LISKLPLSKGPNVAEKSFWKRFWKNKNPSIEVLISQTENLFKVFSEISSNKLFQTKNSKVLIWVQKPKRVTTYFKYLCVDLISKSEGCALPPCKIAKEKFYNYVFPNHDLQNHL
jgi:hypothetical protein